MELPFAESWKIKMVEPIRKSTRQEREQWLKEQCVPAEIRASIYRFDNRLRYGSNERSPMGSDDVGRRKLCRCFLLLQPERSDHPSDWF